MLFEPTKDAVWPHPPVPAGSLSPDAKRGGVRRSILRGGHVTVAEPAPAGEAEFGAANARMGVAHLKRRRAPKPTVVLGITAVCIAMAFIDATIVNIAFPNLERSFHSS